MTTPPERRRRSRSSQATQPGVRLRFRTRQGLERLVSVRLTNLSEYGCGLESDSDLPLNSPVTLEGDLTRYGGLRNAQLAGRITWCDLGAPVLPALTPAAHPRWRAGIEFAAPTQIHRAADGDGERKAKHFPESESSQERVYERPQHERAERFAEQHFDVDDHYEALQLSPNADSDTIHRVFRSLAARFHPDNTETGDAGAFRTIHEAYRVLADPVSRAAYDAAYTTRRRLRWRIFSQSGTSAGLAAERAKRKGILGLLYAKRSADPQHPDLPITELDDLLGVAREHLDFSLWYLREAGLITRGDNGRYAITLKGVMESELTTGPDARRAEQREDHLLTAAMA
jgi:DnaJ domain